MADWQDPSIIALWITIALLVIATMVATIIWFTRLYLKRMLNAQQAIANQQLIHQKKLLETSVIVQERERNRIASELHDDLLSKLSILSLASYGDDPIQKYQKLIKYMSVSTRSILHDLSPPLINEASLVSLLQSHLEPLKNQFSINLLEKHYQPDAIDSSIKLQVYRIFQEVINNIIKHAQADTICIKLRITEHYIALQIVDNGIGFDSNCSPNGLGLRNIDLRTQLLNGKSRFKSVINSGTTFNLIIPTQHSKSIKP